MNDREICIYAIVSLTGFMKSQGGEPDIDMFDHMLETTRIARFPSISKDYMNEIIREVEDQNQKMVKLTQDVCDYLEKKL
jgi:hypothetical protein